MSENRLLAALVSLVLFAMVSIAAFMVALEGHRSGGVKAADSAEVVGVFGGQQGVPFLVLTNREYIEFGNGSFLARLTDNEWTEVLSEYPGKLKTNDMVFYRRQLR